MSEWNKNKRTLISLSSDEEGDSVEGDHDDDEGQSRDYCFSEDEIGDVDEDDESQSGDNGDDDVDDDYDDEESISNKVICVLNESDDLGALNRKECKIYLRKHGLRLSGTKTVCTQKIREHWGIKDGNGEALYPKSSFAINCTGDVCQGDVVLFTQKVYLKFDKVTRHGQFFGKSTIAGRVVSDSYGVAKQQHTFTGLSNGQSDAVHIIMDPVFAEKAIALLRRIRSEGSDDKSN